MDFFSERNFVVAAALSYVLVFIAFFPSYFASIDEHSILKNALLLREGNFALAESNPELACRASNYTSNGYVAGQFAGKSFFLLPFTFLGLEGVMISGLVVHLLNAFLLYLIFKRLSIDARFTILYIFFPAMIWESRTLFSELLVLTFFLGAFYFYLKKANFSSVISGALFGLAAFVRYDAAAGFMAFAAPLIIFDRRKLMGMLAGFVPAIALIALFNSAVYGGALQTGYGSGPSIAASVFSAFGLPTFLLSVLLLALVYPLMLPSIFAPKWRPYLAAFALLALGYLALNSRFTSFLAFDSSFATIVTARMRYLIPLAGMLLIPYALFLAGALERAKNTFNAFNFNKLKFNSNWVYAAALILFIVAGAYASSAHAGFINSRLQTYMQIRGNVPQGALMVGSSDDCIYSLSQNLERLPYLNVMPRQELTTKGPPLKLEERIGSSTYFIELRYSRHAGNDSQRQATIDAERAAMSDFLAANLDRLQLVFDTNSPNPLKIYRWEGG